MRRATRPLESLDAVGTLGVWIGCLISLRSSGRLYAMRLRG